MRSLSILVSTLSLILLFWAVVFVSAISGNGAHSILKPDGFMHHLLDLWQYWYGFVGALFGAFLALAWERKKREEKQKESLAKLRGILVRNSELMVEILKWILPGGKPNFTLDTLGLNLWIAASSGIIDDDLLDDLDKYRYQLDHINTKLAIFYSVTGLLEEIQTDPEKRLQIRSDQEKKLGISDHVGGMAKESARILSLLH
jgi:hypothetical protein